jgi:integrase
MRKRLTDISINALKPKAAQYEVADANARGLRVVVFPSGIKSFIYRYRFAGRTRKLTLQPGLSLAAARRTVADYALQLEQNIDPALAKRAARTAAAEAAANTVAAVCAECFVRDGKHLRSAEAQQAVLRRAVLPVIGTRPITSVTRSELVRLFDKIEDSRGPGAADVAKRILSKVFHWHEGRSDTFRSPIVKAMKPRLKSNGGRSRVLSDDELRKVWLAAEKDAGAFGAQIQLLLLTAARRNEVAGMKFDEIIGSDWHLPAERNKVAQALVRPLSKQALAILQAQPRVVGGPYVFGRSGHTPFGGFGVAKRRFDKACDVSDWRLHDLRRTSRSLLSRAGVPSDHAERCLGHIIGGVRGVYDRHAFYQEKKRAFAALARQIERIIRPPKKKGQSQKPKEKAKHLRLVSAPAA